MTVHLEPGTFYAGVNLPFFITESMVKGKIETEGLTNVIFHKRSEAMPPVNVQKYPSYSDDWDTWISADYAGPKKDLDIAKHWAWLLVVPAHASTGPAPTTAPPAAAAPDFTVRDNKKTLIALAALSAVALGLLLHSSKQMAHRRIYEDPDREPEEKVDG